MAWRPNRFADEASAEFSRAMQGNAADGSTGHAPISALERDPEK
jgi:hypothetical protein